MNWQDVIVQIIPWVGVIALLGLGGKFLLPRLSNIGKTLVTIATVAIGVFIAVVLVFKPSAPGAIVRGVAEGADPYRNQVGAVDATMRARLLEVVTDDIYDCQLVADILGETPNPVWCARVELETTKIKAETARIKTQMTQEELTQAYVQALIDAGLADEVAKKKLEEAKKSKSWIELLASPLSDIVEAPDAPASTIGGSDFQMLIAGIYALPTYTFVAPSIFAILLLIAYLWKWR